MKILIIDDNKDLLDMLKIALEGEHDVFISNTGKNGINSLLENEPDLIFLDIMMKGLNGIDILRLIRNDETTKATPLFIMSALVDEKTIDKCKELNANGYLKKPFRIQMLKDIIAKFENSQIDLSQYQIF